MLKSGLIVGIIGLLLAIGAALLSPLCVPDLLAGTGGRLPGGRIRQTVRQSRFDQVWRHCRCVRRDRRAHRAGRRRGHQQPVGETRGSHQTHTPTGNTIASGHHPGRHCNGLLGRHYWEHGLPGRIRCRADGWPRCTGRPAMAADARQQANRLYTPELRGYKPNRIEAGDGKKEKEQ